MSPTSPVPPATAGPFRLENCGELPALRSVLLKSGFTATAVKALIGSDAGRVMDGVVAMRRAGGDLPLDALARLFVIGVALSEEAAAAALAPVKVEGLIEAGLVRRTDEGLFAVARLEEFEGLFLFSDFPPRWDVPFTPDYVMSGASSSTRTLVFSTVRRQVESALDLCTGAGTHALLAARHAKRVLATDVNPRAVNFARLNARLNGVENVCFVEGSFFEPVGDEQFDLIVSNPPFIVSPRADMIFQNAGLGGDAVSELVLRESAAHLREGGFAVVLLNWVHADEQDWEVPLRAWVQGTGCDLWVMRSKTEEPLSYSAETLRQSEDVRGLEYETLIDQWLAWYRERGIRRITIGAAFLRKRACGENWVRFIESPDRGLNGTASTQVQRIFASEDFLRSLPNEAALLSRRLIPHPDHALDQRLTPASDGWAVQSLTISATHGFGFAAKLDAHALAFLTRCDGQRTVGELIADIANDAEIDFSEAVPTGLRIAQGMLRNGMLVPAETGA